MRNLKLILEYDGTSFAGFQRQPGRQTIQEILESSLSKYFNKPMKIKSASGRTDAGVHAKFQVVNFKTERQDALWQIQKGLNAHLPREIVVRKISEVSAAFHARFDAKSKTYEYLVWNDPVRAPFYEQHAHHAMSPLNLVKMRKAAGFLKGKHDFRAFCATGKEKEKEKNKVRTIKRILIIKEASLLRFRFTADGFLHHMVRNIMGILLEVGRGKLAPEAVKQVLDSRDRRLAAMTAPAKGLFLINVNY